jgi:uncharacterized repeat protein (TIGR03803 family)
MDRNGVQGSTLRSIPQIAVLLILLFVALAAAAQQAASGSYRVIHDFIGGKDGSMPYAGLIIDKSGNLYGTAFLGGRGACPPQYLGCGTVFEMTPSASGWIFKTLYAFRGGHDGAAPDDTLTFGADGSLCATTNQGGNQACLSGCGVVFRLKPPSTVCETELCPWTESVLYRFKGGNDGFYPYSNVTFDKAGNLYGTTEQGGSGGNGGPGTVYKLTPSKHGWTKTILYNFSTYGPGNPYSGVIFGKDGNLYGTAASPDGAVYQLSRSASGWTEKTIYTFQGNGDGCESDAGLILGKSNNFIGATAFCGPEGEGTAYSLRLSGDHWDLTTLYGFPGPGSGPYAQLAMDAAGNLYGTTQGLGGYSGSVFKLTHSSSGWKETVLHSFSGGSDGGTPYSTIVFDSHGNLYGTASQGGAFNDGVVFEITP